MRLLAAAKNHDTAFILSILDQHILNSLGGSGGVKEFKEQWKLDETGDEFWNTLIAVLTKGGSFSESDGKKEFCAPYVTSKWKDIYVKLPTGSDPSDYQAIINNNVGLRAEPNPNSSLIATLSYDVVRVLSDLEPSAESKTAGLQWVKISTFDGKVGYVDSTNIRSPSDYYACFQKVGSTWVMTTLAAGD